MVLSLAIATISCQKEASQPEIPLPEKTPRLLKAVFSPETRAAISDNFGSVSWNPSDSISVFDSDSGSGGNKFVTQDGGATAVFAGQASDPDGGYYYGVYPYSNSTSLASTVISASLPAVQNAVSGSFDPAAFLMVGRSASTDKMGFYDALGGIRFTVSESGYDKVIFSGNGNEPVAGAVVISFGEDGIPLCRAASSETSTQISLEGDFNAGDFYYISMVPQSFKKGFTLTFYKGGMEVSRSVCESFVRVQRYYFATVRNADIPSSLSNILDGEPLDAAGTANCYIVRESGSYKLPLVKGNLQESVGAVDHAGVLWETDNTATVVKSGALVNSTVRVKNGYLYFKTAEQFKPGNALIAAYDSNDNILWSWHIWLCDFDPDQTAQRYQGASLDMMDRNLGALSSSFEGVASYGLFYQWGRKDPFMGAASTMVPRWLPRVFSIILAQTVTVLLISPLPIRQLSSLAMSAAETTGCMRAVRMIFGPMTRQSMTLVRPDGVCLKAVRTVSGTRWMMDHIQWTHSITVCVSPCLLVVMLGILVRVT